MNSLRRLFEQIPVLRRFGSIARHLAGLQNGFEELNRQFARLEDRVDRLETELHAVPYMSHPEWVEREGTDGLELAYGPVGTDQTPRFDELFRGASGLVQVRLGAYIPFVRGHEPIADLGCGRGDFLTALKEVGIPATGVDTNRAAVRRAREAGVEAVEADLLGWLDSRPDESLGAVTAFHVVEHLEASQLQHFLAATLRVLRPGGLLLAETVNVHSLSAFKAFWTDPSHRTPLFPEVLLWLARLAGFSEARIFFPLTTGELQEDRWRCGEYALMAKKAS